MCGSGTIVIEAALIAADTAPRLVALGQACAPGAVDPSTINARILADRAAHPKVIPALRWVDADLQAWEEVLQEACEADRRSTTPVKIFANDLHEGSIALAKDAAARAGVQYMIDFSNCDIRDYRPPVAPDFVVTNPPWQLRIQTEEDPWRLLRDWCKQHATGGTMLWVSEPVMICCNEMPRVRFVVSERSR
jgi:23S rRNA (guanine2445-N2)-methyltransferase / 23S rRNA (guanine2069-N7)-methyltransferase